MKLKYIYTQKKRLASIYVFSQNQQYWKYHFQNAYMSCIIVTLHLPVYCVKLNASIRPYQTYLRIKIVFLYVHDVMKTVGEVKIP